MIKFTCLLSICLLLSCASKEKKVDWNDSNKDSITLEWTGMEMGINKIHIKRDSEGNGFVKLVYHGQNEKHFGKFTSNPNNSSFSFVPNQSQIVSLQKSLNYESNNLIIDTRKVKHSVVVVVHNTKGEKILETHLDKKKHIFEMENHENKSDYMVEIRVDNSMYQLEPLNFNYFYTGVDISSIPSFDLISFQKDLDSMKVTLSKKAEIKSSRTYSKKLFKKKYPYLN